MIQLLRRILLLAGLCLATWHFWFTPPTLIAARAIDFNQEYLRKYGPRPRYAFGAMGAAEALIRRTTNPGSAAAFRAERISSRSIPPSPSSPASFAPDLAAAAAGRGPLASRFSHSFVFFDSAHPLVLPFAGPLRQSLRRTNFLNAYTQAGGRDVELMIFPEPHSSSAPASVMYPLRARAWLFAAAALGLYLLLGLARSSGARHDPLPLAVLDLAAATTDAFFFGLPLLVCYSTQAALDDPLGGPVFSWAVSLILAGGLLVLARRAAWRLRLTESALRLETLISSTEVPLTSLSTAAFHLTPDGGETTGIDLRLVDGRIIPIDWTGLIDFLPVLDHLRRHGLLLERRAAPANL